MARLKALQPDNMELLLASAHAAGPMQIGRRYWSRSAITEITTMKCAGMLRDILKDQDIAMEHVEQGALCIVSGLVFVLCGLHFAAHALIWLGKRYYGMLSTSS